MNQCVGTQAVVVKSTDLSGDDCNWQVIYTYEITCGDFQEQIKIMYEGGDITVPTLNNGAQVPADQTDLNLCFDAIPVGPSADAIAALYSDNCSEVIVVKKGSPVGNDCEWTVIYSYEITDACGNEAQEVKITYSGGDTEAPMLNKKAVIPTGEVGVNACFLNKSQGPSEEEIADLFSDNCGNVNVVKTASSKGTDCKWLAVYEYTISDDCGNFAEPIIITYKGYDQNAPVLNGVPDDITVSCIDELPSLPNVTAIDDCTKKIGKIIYSQDSSQLGLACAGGTVVRSWTATDTCGNSTTESQIITVTPAPQPEFDTPQDYKISCEDLANFQPTSLSYSNGITTGACAVNGEVVGVAEPFEGSCGSFVVNFTYTDECDYTITSSLTVTVEDLTAPEISGGNNLKVECDGSGNYTTNYMDDLSSQQYFGESDNLDIGCFVGNDLFAVVNFVRTGFDENGYAVYAQGSRQDTSAYYYTINYNSNNGRWETFEYDAASNQLLSLIWYNVSTDNTPSCNPSDWNIDGSVCSSIFVDCGFFYLDYTEYTLVRTFTQEDLCGNEGECSVTYTWIEGENNNNDNSYAPSSAPEETTANGAPISVDVEARTSQVELDFTAYPVPFDKEVNISYSFEFDTDVTIELYDTKGLLINSISNNRYVKGSTDKAYFDLSRTSNQMFYVKLTTSQGSVTKKIVSSSPNRRN